MAILNTSTGIYPEGSGYLQQYGVFTTCITTSNTYYHMKTNIPNASYVMIMLEAVGYNYSNGLPLRCSWNIYSYSYQISNVNNGNYGGATADGVYISGDGYYVIRLYSGSLYYCGFTINVYNTAGNGYGYPTTVTAAVANNNTTYY